MSCCGQKSLGIAAIKVMQSAAGIGLAPEAIIRDRRRICAQCEHALIVKVGGLSVPATCKICGCIISLKTRLAAESCPADPPRWNRFSDAEVGQPGVHPAAGPDNRQTRPASSHNQRGDPANAGSA